MGRPSSRALLELDRLDAFLASDESPEDRMMLSDLDGFLHGIACAPVVIPAGEWMTVTFGGEPEEVPEIFHAMTARIANSRRRADQGGPLQRERLRPCPA